MSGRALLVAAGLVIVVAVAVGMLLLGSPADERARRMDEARLEDLQKLRTAIDLHRRREGRLPGSLTELARGAPRPVRTTDPETREPYGYAPIDSMGYRLCATFRFSSPDDEYRGWVHKTGRQCFRLRASRHGREDPPEPEDGSEPILEGAPDSTP